MWFWYVKRRDDDYVGKRVMRMEVEGRRKRGRPKRRWMDCVSDDMKKRCITETDAHNRTVWKRMVANIDPT